MTIQAHHRASGETGVTSYFDPLLSSRANLEVQECRLPHSSPWTGLSPIPSPDADVLAAARATLPHQGQAPTTNASSRPVDYLNATDEEAQALDREVAWSSGSLTPLERSPSPTSPMTPVAPATPATILDLHTIKSQVGAIAHQHIENLSDMDSAETYFVRAKAINYLFQELYHLRTAFQSADPASSIFKAIGPMVEIMLWHRSLLVSEEDLEMVKKNLQTIRHLRTAAKTAPLGGNLPPQDRN